MIAVIIVLIFLGVIIHFLNDKAYLYYFLILYFFVPFFISLFLNLSEEDNQVLTNYSPLFLIPIFLIELVKNRFKIINGVPFICFVILFVYIIAGAIFHGAPTGEYILHFLVSFVIPLFCLSNLFFWSPPEPQVLSKFIVCILGINLVLAFLQYFGGFMVLGFKEDSVSMSGISGTLSGGNTFAFYLLLFFFYLLLREKQITQTAKWCLIIAIVTAILLTGVRTYLLCAIIFIPLCLLLKREENFNPFVVLIVLLMIALPLILLSRSNSSGYGTNDAENAVQRQVYGLSTFAKGESADERSTLFLSLYVFTDYFIHNPFFGQWLLYTNESYNLVSPANNNVMDAGIAVYLSDIGIVGMLLYILFQIKTLLWQTDNKLRKYVILLYLYILLTTDTDIGVFGGALTCCTFIVCYLLQTESEEMQEQTESIEE